MAEALLSAMTVAAMLYALFGGADFGAGMVDLFLGAKVRARIDVAIAPVWEANHVWLVLVVVLAFVGFPLAYTTVTTLLHIPLGLALVGIVARGSAFTFRHYDPLSVVRVHAAYNAAFRLGSVLTPMCLGLTLAAGASGRLTGDLSEGFYRVYVAPWNTLFGWSTALLLCLLFAFEGASLLAAEHPRNQRAPLPYLRLARRLHVASLCAALLTLWAAHHERTAWSKSLWDSPFALACLAVAGAFTPLIARAFERGNSLQVRAWTASQLLAAAAGFFGAQFPALLWLDGRPLSYRELAAPDAVLRGLGWAVAVGLLLILPALAFLLSVYKSKTRMRRG